MHPHANFILAALLAATAHMSYADPTDSVIRHGLEQPDFVQDWVVVEGQPVPPIDAVMGTQPPDKPVYGFYVWAENYVEQTELIRSMGWSRARISGPMSDAAMRLLSEDGIDVMVTLGTWVHASPDWGNRRESRHRGKYDSDEAFIEDFLKGVEKYLNRWGPRGSFYEEHPELTHRPISSIEIWNEPNFWYFDRSEPEHYTNAAERVAVERSREKLYAKLLVAAYPFIKERWPELQVVAFGAGGVEKADVRFIRNVHAADPRVAQSYDILSTHPYVKGTPPTMTATRPWGRYSIASTLAEIREIQKEYGAAEKPIWYTELNFETRHEEGGRYGAGKDWRPARRVPLLNQAAYYVQGYAWAMRLGVPFLAYMSITDVDNVNSGIFQMDGTPRPAARAIRTMMKTMPNPWLAGAVIEDFERGVFAYDFGIASSDSAPAMVRMVWSQQVPQEVEMAWSGDQVEIIDMVGESAVYPVQDGKLILRIGACPIYLRMPR